MSRSMNLRIDRCILKFYVLKACIAAIGFVLLAPLHSVYADKSDVGLPACEQIVGVDRHIEVGHTVSYTLGYLEENNYRCDEFKGKINEIISCTYRFDRQFEILLTVEEGIVTDIDTLHDGLECSYFSIMPADPRDIDPDREKDKEKQEE